MSAPAVLVQPDFRGGESQADLAYREIRALIVTLELAPGALISEPELQERLGLGRTPIREALRTLAHERLVEVYPRRGMFVAALDPRDLA
ncbi:MAG: GntR family transcriptional regulator, partial [Candidatus Nanopelagicales bacterium]